MGVIRTPDGRKLRVPDTASAEEIQQVIASLPPAEEWQPKKRGLADIQREAKSEAAFKGNTAEDMSFGEATLAGMGQSLTSAAHKGNKLIHQLGGVLGMDNDEELARLDEETRDRRAIDQQLLNTEGGQVGQALGDATQGVVLTAATGGLGGAALGGAKMIPGLARAGGAISRTLPTAARAATSAPARAIALDATAGGAQGALMDTTTDESTMENVREQAAFAALFPGLNAARKTGAGKAVGRALKSAGDAVAGVPVIGWPLRPLMYGIDNRARNVNDQFKLALQTRNTEARELEKAAMPGRKAAERVARQQEQTINQHASAQHSVAAQQIADVVKKATGAKMGDIAQSYSVRSTPDLSKRIAQWKAGNQSLLKKKGASDVVRALDLLGMDNARMTGERAQYLKSRLGELARSPKLSDFKGPLHEMEREITNQIYRSLRGQPGGAAKAKALREAFELNAKAQKGLLNLPGPKPQRQIVNPQYAPLNLPPIPIHPSQRPYSRTPEQALQTAGWRGLFAPREEYEE